MKQLVERSGLPRTTVHFYLRQGLLPAPETSGRNTATYSEAHLDRLKLITQLRSGEFGELSLSQIRAAVAKIESGMDPGAAVATVSISDCETCLDLRGLSETSGLDLATAQRLVAAGVLEKAPMSEGFDALDVEVARSIGTLLSLGMSHADLIPIAQMVRKIVAYEASHARRALGIRNETDRAEALLSLQSAGNALHRYLFIRARQSAIHSRHAREGRDPLAFRQAAVGIDRISPVELR